MGSERFVSVKFDLKTESAGGALGLERLICRKSVLRLFQLRSGKRFPEFDFVAFRVENPAEFAEFIFFGFVENVNTFLA